MARVTVEDCILKVSNRFELVMMAAHRARKISVDDDLTVERDNDKNPVVALREIAEDTISPDDLREGIVASLQECTEADEPVEDGGFDEAATPLGTPAPPPEERALAASSDGAEAPWPEAGGFEDVPDEAIEDDD